MTSASLPPTEKLQADAERGLRAPRAASCAARRWRSRGWSHARAAFTGGRAVLGCRHRRHALRPLPRAGRAARHLREARGLRGRLHAWCARRPAVSLHIPWDKPGEPGRAARVRRRARAALRRHELEHVPGPARPEHCRTSSAASPIPIARCASRPSRTTWSASTSAAGAGLDGAHGVDRGRRQFSRPDALSPRPRPLPGEHARDLRRPARRLAPLHRAQALRAGLLLDGRQRLGHQLLLRARARGRRPSASWISATTRPTSTSR